MTEYELSTELFALRRKLAEHHSGLVLTADDVAALTGKLKSLGIIAQRQEHEMRRLRLENARAVTSRHKDDVADAVVAAAAKPGSNVTLLTFERPFSDGAPS